MRLIRLERRPDGIISRLESDDGAVVAVTLEHSFDGEPKIPSGTFKCVRSTHRLHGMETDFETFEVMGVPGHTGLLFHWGNYNEDSDGCVLTGESYAMIDGGRRAMVTNSRATFKKFMDANQGIDSFMLAVVG